MMTMIYAGWMIDLMTANAVEELLAVHFKNEAIMRGCCQRHGIKLIVLC